MAEMTDQELFDKVATHLLTQGKRSVQEGGNRCLYRGPDGLKCAAGVLIDDEQYKPMLERRTAITNEVQEALRNSGVQQEQIGLVRELQNIHDGYQPIHWPESLRNLAKQKGLSSRAISLFTPGGTS